jgi:hypothetical protein
MEELFPDFSTPQNWYDIVMLYTDCQNNMKAISKSCHSSFIYDAYASLRIVHPTVTHAGRKNGRQLLD